jgi:hypothetical protein
VLKVKSIIGHAYFWLSLESFLGQMIPTIEASLMMQDEFCTLADAMYEIGRLYQVAYREEERAVVASLENRFWTYEIPLFFLALWLRPRYKKFGDSIARDGSRGMGLVLVTEWAGGYLDRWFPNFHEEKLGNLSSIVSGLCAWEDMSDPTLRHASAMKHNPCRFWGMMKDSNARHSQGSEVKAGLYGLSLVTENIFSILPNAANTERPCSEIGRPITPARTYLTPEQSNKLLVIAEDYRISDRETDQQAGRAPPSSNKRISDTSAARDLLRKIG